MSEVAHRFQGQIADQIKAVNLDWYEDNETVKVTPRDQNRFDIQKDRAIQYLQLAKQSEEFGQQFELLLNCVAAWLHERPGQVQTAYLTLQDGSLTLLMIRKTKEYDEKFIDELSELELEIANDADLSLISLNTIALPPASRESLLSFLDERLILSYHGQ